VRRRSATVSFEDYQPVPEQVYSIGLTGWHVILPADRGFVYEKLLHYIRKQQWHFRLRLTGDTRVHLSGQRVSAVRDLCPPVGVMQFFHQVALFGIAVGPAHLALACSLDHPDDPWFVASDELTHAKTLDEYGSRFDIEEAFLDEKSGGFQLRPANSPRPKPWSV
jgi:hypothetical protein